MGRVGAPLVRKRARKRPCRSRRRRHRHCTNSKLNVYHHRMERVQLDKVLSGPTSVDAMPHEVDATNVLLGAGRCE